MVIVRRSALLTLTILQVFNEYEDDQFDFHGYSLRRFTLNVYFECARSANLCWKACSLRPFDQHDLMGRSSSISSCVRAYGDQRIKGSCASYGTEYSVNMRSRVDMGAAARRSFNRAIEVIK